MKVFFNQKVSTFDNDKSNLILEPFDLSFDNDNKVCFKIISNKLDNIQKNGDYSVVIIELEDYFDIVQTNLEKLKQNYNNERFAIHLAEGKDTDFKEFDIKFLIDICKQADFVLYEIVKNEYRVLTTFEKDKFHF